MTPLPDPRAPAAPAPDRTQDRLARRGAGIGQCLAGERRRDVGGHPDAVQVAAPLPADVAVGLLQRFHVVERFFGRPPEPVRQVSGFSPTAQIACTAQAVEATFDSGCRGIPGSRRRGSGPRAGRRSPVARPSPSRPRPAATSAWIAAPVMSTSSRLLSTPQAQPPLSCCGRFDPVGRRAGSRPAPPAPGPAPGRRSRRSCR